ncbi:MAG: hypothetical protein MI866_00740 [Bacteroidales bacterium]|nr:hypothetical protein [Bacteroidales bacterium]
MKHFCLFITVVFLCSTISAQVNNGVLIGINSTFKTDSKDHSYSSRVGYQIGYNWNIGLSPKLSFSVSPSLIRNNVETSYLYDLVNLQNEKQYSLGVSAPISINYHFNQLFVFTGYALTHSVESTLTTNVYDHSLFLGVGYSTSFVDINLKYGGSINADPNNEVVYAGNAEVKPIQMPISTYKASTLQLSLVIPLKRK